MAPVGTYYGDNRQRQTKVIAAVVAFTGLEVERAPFEFGVTNKSPEFLTKFPMGKIPAFEDESGYTLVEGTSIAHYLASIAPQSGLLGSNVKEAAQIDQWIHFTESEILTYVDRVYGLVLGMTGDYNKGAHDYLINNQNRALDALEKYLSTHSYLVGDSITLADIILTATIGRAVAVTLGAAERAIYPNIIAYFDRLTAEPQFKGTFTKYERIEVAKAFEEKPAST
ncbi:glutathione S-transferase C-terminal-like protein [Hygrophoropsis aurantiaca]|uniref:Glutathione S-transferase C-terminal-like protein n=1 Tax=Hygrophoropsis aurantiaca TaxID=72124 RepID=A0ACB8ADI2_9AGAM|nr:glutathione S-transferase C-terminal-like protein [Hygrophoropsis aurantiaca]